MAEDSRAWSGTVLGDAGPYSATDWQNTWRYGVGQDGASNNRGVYRGVLEELEVTAPGTTQVTINTGVAIVQGIWYINDADSLVTINANSSGSTRIDVIVLRASYAAQTVRITKIQGTPGSGVPAITQSAGVTWDIPLAYVTAVNGFVTIAQSDITDWREWADLPNAIALDITNNSASVLESGAVVVWDATGDRFVNTSTTLGGSGNVAGVVERRIGAGGTGRIIVSGYYPVIVSAVVSRGNLLTQSTTAGRSVALTTNQLVYHNPYARALTAQGTVGQRCMAFINVPINQRGSARFATGTYTGNGGATQAITGVGFQPRRVLIFAQSAAVATAVAMKTDLDGTNSKILSQGASGAYTTDHIISLDADGFTVGDGTTEGTNRFNINLTVYTFECLG